MGQSMENVNVLVVDDDEVDVLGVKRAFRDIKLINPVAVAKNGREALDKLRAGEVAKPYMILLDLNMPRMNGLEFLEEIRRDEKLKSAVVFVLTTSKDPVDRRRAYEHNVAGYITKNGSRDGFLNTAQLFDQYARTVDLV